MHRLELLRALNQSGLLSRYGQCIPLTVVNMWSANCEGWSLEISKDSGQQTLFDINDVSQTSYLYGLILSLSLAVVFALPHLSSMGCKGKPAFNYLYPLAFITFTYSTFAVVNIPVLLRVPHSSSFHPVVDVLGHVQCGKANRQHTRRLCFVNVSPQWLSTVDRNFGLRRRSVLRCCI